MSEESRKDWERPWTTEEIVQHADNWNLACDTALLNTLKAFGDKILKKAEDVNEKIENLSENLSKVHLQVDLARNDFSSLRNTQFVECRVYEDDETLLSGKQKDEEETNVPKEETIEDFKEAVALGLEILDEYYDKIDVTVSDSEGEDEDEPSYVYRRKDPYINRRLPLVIGSEEWHKKWHVGLEETDSENENSSEKLSDSESEDNFSQNKDHSDVSSELSNFSGFNTSKIRPVAVSTTNATRQDLLASASGSDDSEEPTPKTLSFAEQLAAKLGNVIKDKEAPLEESEVNRRPVQKKPSDYGALFSNEPPPLEDINEQESQGIFSGGKGLFDDEDDDDLWNSGKTKLSSTKSFPTGRRKTDQDKGLFDDDSDDGIFAPSKNGVTQPSTLYIQSNKPLVPVFDEEPPLFKEETNTKEKKKPTGGVSLFGKSDILSGQDIGKILKQRKASSSEDELKVPPKEEIKSSIISPVNFADTNPNLQYQHSYEQTISSVPQSKEPEKKKSSLFDDDIFSDDLFSSSSGLFEKSILFSEEDVIEPILSGGDSSKTNSKTDESKKLPSNIIQFPETPDNEYSFRKSSKSNISSLFDDSRDDNIFESDRNDAKKQSEVEKDLKKSERVDNSDNDTNIKKQKLNLFEDDLDDVDDLFSGISKKNSDTRNNKSMGFLFDDNEDDFNIFMPTDNKNAEKKITTMDIQKSTEKKEIREKDKTNIITNPKEGLFEDDLDDLFSQVSEKNAKKPASKSGTSSDSFKKRSDSSTDSHSNQTNFDGKYEKSDDVTKPFMEEKMSEDLEKAITSPETKTNPADDPGNTKKPVIEIDVSENSKTSIKIDEINNSKDDSNIKQDLPKEDKHTAIPEISIVEESEKIVESTDKASNLQVDINRIPNDKYKSSPNVLNVKFMDSIPPPDDDWDTYSDNTFDDMDPGNDGFQSQPSSLFDNEPPFLFFDDTGGVFKEPNDRYAQSTTQEVPSDFSSSLSTSNDGKVQSNPTNNLQDTYRQSNDGPGKSINKKINDSSITPVEDEVHSPDSKTGEKVLIEYEQSAPTTATPTLKKDNLNSSVDTEKTGIVDEANDNKVKTKPPISGEKPGTNKKREKSPFDIPAATETNAKSGSSFDHVQDEDQTDFLFSSNDSSKFKISENIISDDKSIEKSVSFDNNLEENPIEPDKPSVGTDSDDNMQSNISKITEKLQQISNKNEERTKPLAVPRKLSHNLNINVGALLPGSALPKRDKARSPDEYEKLSQSLPASRFSLNEEFAREPNAPTKPMSIVRVSSEHSETKPEYKLEKSVSFDGGTDTEVLQSVTKDRVRIPIKRRPSSRRARQKSLRDSLSDFKLDDPILDGAVTSGSEEQDSMNKSANQQSTQDKQSSVNCEEEKNREQTFSIKHTVEVMAKNNIMNDDVGSEDLCKTINEDIKNVPKASIISTKKKELFEDEIEELFKETNTEVTKKIDSLFQEDLFGSLPQVSNEIHESKIQAENSGLETSYITNKKTIFSDDNSKINEERDQYDFLRSIENYPESKKPKVAIDNLFDSSDDEDIFKSTKVVVKESKSIKDVQKKNEEPISIIRKITGNADSTSPNVQNEKTKPDNLFDFSDDDDFLGSFKSGKNDDERIGKKSAGKRQNNLFDDMDDDDIFGTSSTENKTKQDVKPSVINKKPPKSTSLRKLENIEGEEDPLSALLK